MDFLDSFLLWCNMHRTAITLLVAAMFWGLAYGIYFRRSLVRFTKRRRVHSWKVDLTTKTAYRANKVDANGGKRLM